jgi:hypothetical protein
VLLAADRAHRPSIHHEPYGFPSSGKRQERGLPGEYAGGGATISSRIGRRLTPSGSIEGHGSGEDHALRIGLKHQTALGDGPAAPTLTRAAPLRRKSQKKQGKMLGEPMS